MANAVNATQKLVYKAMGNDELAADASLTQIQWDSQGVIGRQIVVNFGTLGGNGIAAFTVNASDTSGFTEGSANEIFNFSDTTLPADADDNTIWVVDVPENAGRYLSYVITNGAGATADVSVMGQGTSGNGPLTDSDRGVADFQFGAVA